LPFFLLFCFDLTLLAVEEPSAAPPEVLFRFWADDGEVRSPGELVAPGVAASRGPLAGLADEPCKDDDPVACPELDEGAADEEGEELGANASTAVGLGTGAEALAKEPASEPPQLSDAGL
jgi:hypothetical protein